MHATRRITAELIAKSALLGSTVVAATPVAAEPPPLLLANDYDEADIELSHYWVSEKYDGMRAYWDGAHLLTRAGHLIHAPEWFTHGWPATPMDGELWAGRGRFEQLTATARDLHPDEIAWRQLRFMVFDLPHHRGTFDARLSTLESLFASLNIEWLREVKQSRIVDESELHRQLDAVAAAGGEGLMLHRGDSLYRAERSDDLLKLKPHQDAEARVVAHLPGQGKYIDMLCALLVRDARGTQFRIGGGFTDEQRRNPPPIGSWVTYSYHGTTARGLPRFARFIRAKPPDGH